MNTLQLIRQIKYRLQQATWPGSSTEVFGSAIVSVRMPDQLLERQRLPLAAIRPGGAQADPERGEETELLQQTFLVRLYAANEHDGEAEAAIIGANRASATESKGRGLLEIEERLLKEIGRITGVDGAKVVNSFRSSADVEAQEDVAVVFRDYMFDALVGNDRFYHPPTRLVATDATGGDASLTWKLPPDRFDSVTVEIVRKAGSSAPANPTDGTSVNKSATDTTHTDSPGAGEFSYAAFAWYDEDSDPAADEVIFSDSDTSTVTVT